MRSNEHIRSIASLGTPIVIAQLGTIVQSFADTIMVGQYGTAELSAAGFVNNVFNLVLFFILGLSYSTTPVVGAFWGQGKKKDARRTLNESIVVSLCGCAFVMLLLTVLYFNIEWLDQPVELLPLIRPYFLTLLASLPFVGVFNSFKQFSDATDDTRSPMWVMIGGNVLNVVLNYLLIFSADMGLTGAGVATLLSRLMMVVCVIIAVQHQHVEVFATYWRCSKEGVMNLAKIGMPISIQLCLEACSFNICAVFMGWISSPSLAAHQVMCTVSQLCFMVHYGVGAAAAILISHFCGQNDMRKVRQVAFTAYGMTLTLGVIFTSLILLMRGPITKVFTADPDVFGIVMALMVPFAAYQFGDCTQIIFSNALRGIGRVKNMMTDATIAYILVSIPLSYLFGFVLNGGPQGVWWGTPFGLTIAGIIFVARFLHYTKTRNYD